MTRALFLALAILFTANIAVDAFDSECYTDADCCACVCRVPMVQPDETSLPVATTLDAPRIRIPDVVLTFDPFDKSLFRPPKAVLA